MIFLRLLIALLVVAAFAALAKLVLERLSHRRLRLRYAVAGVVVVLFAIFFVVQRLDRVGDAERIAQHLEAMAASGDYRICIRGMTERYVEQVTGEQRLFARAACQQAVDEAAHQRIQVRDVRVEGDKATAREDWRSGSLAGSALWVSLVDVGGEWKLDRRLGFAHFDRGAFRHGYEQGIRRSGSPAAGVACATAAERRFPDGKIEKAAVDGEQQRLFAPIAVRCDREGVERGLMGAFAEFEPEKRAVACLEHRIDSLPAAGLAQVSARLSGYVGLVTECDPDAFRHYLHHELAERGVDPPVVACVTRGLSTHASIRLVYDHGAQAARLRRCEST